MSINSFLQRNKQHVQLGITGAAGGAAAGAVGGPIGALIGGVVGLGAGEVAASTLGAGPTQVQGDNPTPYYYSVLPEQLNPVTTPTTTPAINEKTFVVGAVVFLVIVLILQRLD